MHILRKTAALSALSAVLLSVTAFAQDRPQDRPEDRGQSKPSQSKPSQGGQAKPNQGGQSKPGQGGQSKPSQGGPSAHNQGSPGGQASPRGFVRHNEWKQGYRVPNEDWNRGEVIDYRVHHLRRPPSGYEWREIDGNYVLAAVATGIITSIVAATAR